MTGEDHLPTRRGVLGSNLRMGVRCSMCDMDAMGVLMGVANNATMG